MSEEEKLEGETIKKEDETEEFPVIDEVEEHEKETSAETQEYNPDISEQGGGFALEQQPEDVREEFQEPEDVHKPKKKRSWKKWAIGLSIAAGLGIAGDAYFQGAKPEIKLNYEAGKGCVQLYNRGTAEASRYYTENLEAKVVHTKTVMKYEENKLFYGMGIGALAGISIYSLLKRKKRANNIKNKPGE